MAGLRESSKMLINLCKARCYLPTNWLCDAIASLGINKLPLCNCSGSNIFKKADLNFPEYRRQL